MVLDDLSQDDLVEMLRVIANSPLIQRMGGMAAECSVCLKMTMPSDVTTQHSEGCWRVRANTLLGQLRRQAHNAESK